MNVIAAILADAAASNNVTVLSQGGSTVTLEYLIPIFLAMVFVAALVSSKTKIPHTMILLGFGISISLLSLEGFNLVNFNQFRINPNLIITFIIPPLIFEAMMNVDYKQFKAIRISALLLATIGVIIATLIGGFLLMYVAGLPFLVAFAFAALISPTDATIVIEIFCMTRSKQERDILYDTIERGMLIFCMTRSKLIFRMLRKPINQT